MDKNIQILKTETKHGERENCNISSALSDPD